MKVSALASGSSGNCFYIEDSDNAILVDCGISCKQIITRLSLLNRNVHNIRGIFLTHEHSDHTKGADVFARKFNIPIFATQGTINSKILCNNNDLIVSIKNNETFSFSGFDICAFSKSHRAADPVSFKIYSKNTCKNVSVITDIGYVCDNVRDAIKDSNCLFMESNHDIEMLENGSYPYYLKEWIKSDNGHLSNSDSAINVFDNPRIKLKNIILSHLSENNNTPLLALSEFQKELNKINFKPKIGISGRFNPTKLIEV